MKCMKILIFKHLGETIRVFRRSRTGNCPKTENNNSNPTKGEDHDDDMHSSKHAEDLPAPDTPAAVKDAGSKYVYLNIQKRCIHVILIVKRRRTQILVQSKKYTFQCSSKHYFKYNIVAFKCLRLC